MPGVQLFSDLCFFVVQRVPFRASLIKEIEHHGGRVVNLERQADQVIADHLRKDAPAGSLSYTWIHDSIKAGELQDLNLHQACRARPVSSARVIPSGTALSRPVKSTRTPFTVEDDIMLWNWVARHGGPKNFKGNEIYKKLEIEVRLLRSIHMSGIDEPSKESQTHIPVLARPLREGTQRPSSARRLSEWATDASVGTSDPI